jgi:iron complex outermembrane receptor protein
MALFAITSNLGRVAAARPVFVALLAGAIVAPGVAQSGGPVQGRLLHALTGEPVSGATVRLEELDRQATSAEDGAFRFDGVPPGLYHLAVRADGFSPLRMEITTTAAGLNQDVLVNPELHFTEVLSVSPDARNQFDAYQPTAVLAGQDLSIEVTGAIGSALSGQTGVAERSFGPGPSRPVIRGLDGDRVLVLEDGQRTGDLSSQSGDHGVNVNPAAATRLEVVRGPATLLYGANAIGGLVNVISETIPTRPTSGVTGSATFDLGSANAEAGGAADVLWGDGRWALRAGGSGRRSGDVDTPEGVIENSQSRAGFFNAAGAWTAADAYVGGSYAWDDVKYGIPIVEGGEIQLTPRRHIVNVRGERRNMAGVFESLRGSFGYRRYRHDELEGDEIGTQFKNDTLEAELRLAHRPAGRMKGSVGIWTMGRAFEAVGEEALAPPVDQTGFAAFVYEEATWPHVTLQFGGRVEHASFSPSEGLRPRGFTNGSGSIGLLVRPTDETTIAVSLARAARNPALEELYFFGPHLGNFAFEIGNEDLESENALGFDAAFRWRYMRTSGEVAFFRNDISDYIFRLPTGEIEEDLPVVEFVGADSVLQGVESHFDVTLTSQLTAEAGFDYVRGELKDSGDSLPRMPPFRFRGGLRYQRNALQIGGQATVAADQDRVFGEETPTEGYELLKLYAAYSFTGGGAVNTITARLDNAANELYRNHLSYIKDFTPEMGRSFKLVYIVRF